MRQLNLCAPTRITAPRPLKILSAATLVLLTMMLPGCGGGSSGGGEPTPPISTGAADEGELLIGLTDAEGDFLSYTVTLEALTLHRANGDTVQALPLATAVDFTELTEVTEFLTVATVPAGTYQTVSLRLNYTDASIIVQDTSGDAQQAIAVDSQGDPISTLEVRLNLTTSDLIRIAPGRPAAFSLDFDLDASNEINLSTTPAQVVVEPFLLATPELEQDREHRVRGVLDTVDADASRITVKVRPFRHRQGDFGRLTFAVDDDTAYEIDGIVLSGAAGLEAMGALNENTPVVAGIELSGDERLATSVLAGSSVPWSGQDVVKGVITARAGNALSVRGATLGFASGGYAFRNTVTVTLSDDTSVTAPGTGGGPKTAASLSVGQRVTAFGELVDEGLLDATGGHVRMHQNQLIAEVVQPNPLALDLHFMNGRRPGAFDFSGTGIDAANDADPDFYEIDTAVLDLAALDTGKLLRVRGLVNDFGIAPADFNASTLIDISTDSRGATLDARWIPAEQRPFDSIEPAALALNLEAARALLKLRGIPVGLSNPVAALTLLAPEDDRGLYAVKVHGANGAIHLYRSFSELVTELTARLEAGDSLLRLSAHGSYAEETQTLTTRRASFTFSTAAP